jgi:hypothetical protein
MESKQFKSTRISSAEYDLENWELTLSFVKGGNYRYREVPPETWEAMVEAESVGKFFNKEIRSKFDYQKI